MAIKLNGTALNVKASVAFTSKSKLLSKRVNAKAAAKPMTTPISARAMPRRRTSCKTSSARANDESHGRVGQFRMRPIGHRLRLTIECHVLAVGHDADNFARHVLVFHVNRHALANWLFAGQVLTRKCFVDDDDVALIGSLL